MDSSDSWESILSELDLTDHRQDLVAGGYDHFKGRAAHCQRFVSVAMRSLSIGLVFGFRQWFFLLFVRFCQLTNLG